ncbi:MAG: carbon starvation protein A [Calditrichaeota bacterium]|nr:carbon starvation protein A [Calditrichota bacterium]
MNLLVIFLVSALVLYLAARWYGGGLSRMLGMNDAEPTPAVAQCDNKDFVPTKLHVVFAHHFATIAGAGPIIGPTVAVLYGFVPAWLWVILGGIFFGAVHDFTSLFVSVKEGGKSLAEVTRKTLGKAGFLLFISFTLLMLFLVCGAFLNATAISLTSFWPLAKLELTPDQTVLRAVTNPQTGILEGAIGGIASTSVIIITLLSPLLGWMLYKRGIATWIAYIAAGFIAFGSVLIGFRLPISLDLHVWMVILSLYCFVAAALPVWVVLQPRDFTNVQILYGGMLLLVIGVFASGFRGIEVSYPATNISGGVKHLGFLWPMMFITIACGAISGFHALVAGGTTSKQIVRQTYARKVGYGAMLLESCLALLVLLALSGGLTYGDYMAIVWPEPGAGKANPILAFSLAVGHLLNGVIGIPIYIGTIFGILMVEGFVITSLDSAVRFVRYLLEEFWTVVWPGAPALVKHPLFNSGIAVAGMWGLAAGNSFALLWPIFGSANQLLAALTLITITIWLALRGLKNWFTVVPAIFMTLTTVGSLVLLLFNQYLPKKNWTLVTADLILLALSVTLAVVAVRRGMVLMQSKQLPAAA